MSSMAWSKKASFVSATGQQCVCFEGGGATIKSHPTADEQGSCMKKTETGGFCL